MTNEDERLIDSNFLDDNKTRVSLFEGKYNVTVYSRQLNRNTIGYGTAGSPFEGFGTATSYSRALDLAVDDLIEEIVKGEKEYLKNNRY